MNVRAVVGISLIAFVVLTGNILLFGLIKGSEFNMFYFLFTFATFFLIILTIGSKSAGEFIFSLFFILAVSLSISYCAVSVKDLYDSNVKISASQNEIVGELKNMQSMTDYYLNYTDYLQKNIQAVESNTINLQAAIDKLPVQSMAPQQPKIVYVPVPAPVATPVVPQANDILYQYEQQRETND